MNKILYWVIYKYDDKGKKIEEDHLNGDGSLKLQSTYKYDEKENVIQDYSFLYQYTYDVQRNWIKKIRFDKENNKPKEIMVREITYW